MLTALRRLAATWIAKLLFILLTVSFAIWGVGDMIGNFGRDTALARVAGTPIEMEDAQAAVRREMQRLARTLGGQFEPDARIRRAVAEQTVDQLVLDRVLRAEAERLRIAVPDSAVREFIFAIPGFRGLDGNFSRAVFESFLRSNDMSEPQFLALARADLARQQVSMAVRSGATGPDTLVKPLLQWLQEQRAATLVTLPTAEAPEPPAPTEAALRRFHENNPERFSSPEYRNVAVAVLTADLIAREVDVSEAEIAAAFEQRRAQFETPERRTLEQVLVQDQAKAAEIAATWRAGADFAVITAAAEAAGGQALELGSLDRAGMPVPELAEAAFSAPEGSVTEPVRSPFGWHVLRVVRVEPGHTRSLAEVHDELRASLAQEKAADLAFERANRVEDALAGGATLAEVASRFNLGFATVTTDAEGRNPAGEPVALPVIEASRAPLLRAIFTTERGAAPRLAETEAGFVAVDVRDIMPPALRPFESVEAQVRAAWTADARRRAQEERAAALLTAVRGGKPLAETAREAGLGSREVGALTRTQRQETPGASVVPPELLAPLFELKLNEATMVPTREGFAVAQVLEITPADPAAYPALLSRLHSEVEQAIAGDIEAQYVAALRGRADVRVNPRLMDLLAQP
ncbi:SurA N-terminal domain-containing protein [Siccirubricoccus sp. G192]|uniref:peptidylprolyl isomerase n=1 Tax=Siccirubricoccus sp. G192 TaxID=2849651 RepID=UPI001C2C2511|nr:SurA N-terminal domain-containing protein [Siccirubricoccus sp. G192]MBV1798343.1 SurA N-terminal domain-containing protein [Siccirubricoccus sp. G192]